jgi:hypothetical protein
VFWALALILVAVAAFSIGVALLPRRSNAPSRVFEPVQLRAFLYVGAGALILLAIAVIIIGMTDDRTGVAEALAVLGFFGYALYLGAAVLIIALGRQRDWSISAEVPDSPPDQRQSPQRRPQ